MFENIICEHIKNIAPYVPGKPIEEVRRELGLSKIIKLASNENPLGPSPRALEAIRTALINIHRYPDGSCYSLKKEISNYYNIPEENIVIGNGSNEIIEFLVKLVSNNDFEVISSFPSFLMYSKIVSSFKGKNVVVRLKDFTHDLKAIRDAITDRTRLIFLDNPNNPTGSVISKDTFLKFLESIERDILIVLDEAYMDFVKDEVDTVRGIELFSKDPRIVVLRTFSKLFGLAGLRLGFGVMHRELADALNRIRQPFNVNLLAQIAGVEALRDKTHINETLKTIWEGLDYYEDEFRELGLFYVPSHTNFILVDVKRDSTQVFKDLMKKGIIVRAMGSYHLQTFLRITVGTMEENKECVNKLREVLSNDYA